MAERARTWLVERGGLVVALALAAYVALAPRVIVDGDGAELATLGTVGGVAHPTGYPAYLLWLRALAWLPGASPAHTTAIATAVLGAIQLLVLHAACRAWGARPAAASFAVALYAAGPIAMRYSSQAEVFAFNQLIASAVLYLAAREARWRGGRRVIALGLVAGLGLADHVTCVLVAPVGVLGAVRGVREAERGGRAAAAGVAALVVGLSPYLYLFVTAENAVAWGPMRGLDDLIDHVLRRAYGGPGAFAPNPTGRDVTGHLRALALSLGRAWWWLPGLAGLATLAVRCVRCVRNDGPEPRRGWQMLALAFVLAGPALAARFDLPTTGMARYAVQRFHLLPTLLLAPAVARAFEHVLARRAVRPTVAAGIAALGFATAALLSAPELLRVRTPAVEHAMRGVLHSLPRDAVVIGSGDIPYYGLGYLQVACGERPDVTYIYWSSVAIQWYRERLARRGIVIDTAARGAPSLRLAEQILASGRPLFVDLSLRNVLASFPSYPFGTLFRVLPRGQARPSLDELAAIHRAWFAALDLHYPHPGLDDEYPTVIHDDYAAAWQLLVDAYAAAGRADDAAAAAREMEQIAPWP
ncbi:MAG TPA: DUF2723 domain-containing protein [Kofleriaceae bacterium]|nr:DUF2723 domain-containing protein [Kofleriaceae bacterium]